MLDKDSMQDGHDLASFLQRHVPGAEETIAWGGGIMPLRVATYLAREVPPLPYITSVRSLVFRGDKLLVMHNRDGTHILPGGRREAGETLIDTVRREVLEESGWAIRRPVMLGFRHFRHLAPMPAGYAYPYPDFIQVVYLAGAEDYRPEAIVPDEHELSCTFYPVATVRALDLSPGERLLLDVALAARAIVPI